ncbi:uncharacterized protein PHALS_14377 [Plasmopara halstedii]|uniref:Uncharacterized protein n=1 Tax=Plasmopara halstedii TaxID=4781 RepID=A0A0P1ARV5_PLAHL|nr:uncharacterized protein PHALS_14377 [Plasmopara halstedii]CEG44112.1 hypothetical protein PHALS_14377 [Plasmopara halstedii]|eukprot:XP_024580481.1 hypothetical protein PHALS_14377 [Plasmopara halstedii]
MVESTRAMNLGQAECSDRGSALKFTSVTPVGLPETAFLIILSRVNVECK